MSPGEIDEATALSTLRQEISARSDRQQTLLGLNFTAIAAIAGVVLSDKASELVLVLLPIISSSIGLLWWDHAHNIDRIGDFIGKRSSGGALADYEQVIAAAERDQLLRIPMALALVILFIGAPAAGLIVTLPAVGSGDHVHGAFWVLWATGAALSAACFLAIGRWVVESLAPKRE